jgi:histidine decarboxylase
MRSAHATHLGYPYNLVGYSPVPASFGDYLVNNLGDPYVGSHYGRRPAISNARPSPG